jgi:hypothetical protein
VRRARHPAATARHWISADLDIDLPHARAHRHFRDAGVRAPEREEQVERLRSHCARAVDGVDLAALDTYGLMVLSRAAATELATGRNVSTSNRLVRYGPETFRRAAVGELALSLPRP